MPREAFNTLWADDPVQFETPLNSAIEDGWIGGAEQDPPKAGVQNWWQSRVDSMLQEVERYGAPSYVADAVYMVGALVVDSGIRYMSRTNNNVGNTPASNPSHWQNLGSTFGFVPIGGIILWEGSAASVPPGFVICDGTNGTRNMTDRVPVGAGGLYAVGDTVGANSRASGSAGSHFHNALSAGAHTHAVNSAGAHTHAITVNNHTLTVAQIPPHQHSVVLNTTGNVGSDPSPKWAGWANVIANNQSATTTSQGGGQGHNHGASSGSAGAHAHTMGSAGAHTHTTDASGAHTHTVDVRQPSIGVYFIKRVA